MRKQKTVIYVLAGGLIALAAAVVTFNRPQNASKTDNDIVAVAPQPTQAPPVQAPLSPTPSEQPRARQTKPQDIAPTPVQPENPAAKTPEKPSPKANSSAIQWHTSYGAARAEAKSTGKPLFIDFYAVWCGPCKILDKYVYTDRRFIAAPRKWVMLKIDAERSTQLAATYQVSAFPTLIFFTPDAKAIMRKEGFEIAEEYRSSEEAAIGEITRQMIRIMYSAHEKALKKQPITANFVS